VVYRDLHRLPVVYHWVALAVRWWNRMQLAHAGTGRGGWVIVACQLLEIATVHKPAARKARRAC
jgi:hypothetical protein